MGFVRRVITGALDLANLAKHNDNFADIEADLDAHDGRITTAQGDITAHKASETAHAAEHIAYSGAVAEANTVKEAVDSVKTELSQAIIAGDSGPEAAAARASVSGETYPTLGDRLNAEYSGVNAQLAETAEQITAIDEAKAEQTDLDATNAVIAENASRLTVQENKKISQSDITPELAQQIAGTAPINAIPADYSVVPRQLKKPMVVGVASKNLFDLTDVTAGNYVAWATGLLSPSANYSASNYIPVLSNTAYSISGTSEQLAWYDSSKTYISGIATTGVNMVSPANAAFVRLTVMNSQAAIVQFEAGTAKTTYESFAPKVDNGLLKTDAVKNANILTGTIGKEKMAFIPIEGLLGKNLFNKLMATTGKYVDYTNGVLATNAAFAASDYIPVLPNTTYTKRSGSQFAYYDANKVYISGQANGTTFATPSNCAYIRISLGLVNLDTEQVELGSVQTAFEPYGNKLTNSAISSDNVTYIKKSVESVQITVVTVRKDGTGAYTTIPAALAAITDNSAGKPYVLLIGPGEYTEKGWYMKPFVSLEGESKDTAWIKGEEQASVSDTDMAASSTFWWNCDGCYIKNIKVTAKNMRYPIHADAGAYGNKNGRLNIQNCHIEHYGNQEVIDYRAANSLPAGNPWLSCHTLGMGVSDGMRVIADNTTFQSVREAFYYHTNGNFERATFVQLNNCKLLSINGNWTCVIVDSMGSGRDDILELNGCELRGFINYQSTAWFNSVAKDDHSEIRIVGSGNTPVLFKNVVANSTYRPQLNDEVQHFRNITASTIPKGSVVVYDGGYTSVRPMHSTDDAADLVGVAMSDIPAGALGAVQIRGYMLDTDVLMETFSAATFGAKYGISPTDGKLLLNAMPTVIKGVEVGVVKIK
ncbi:hypothetical protein G5B47_02045 [Paenibacillus sp. 7124]|uniref:Pectinesterase catalytic domain-containing protein n=1 Tax=Paenibacillus apii TaxID=1850370 RepID=A0A6M1PFR9_9BACL|nr:pectinesterase family protein [Paenibacillus apii]NGM81188.1 hypothetical protein [Paenibacillus apii]